MNTTNTISIRVIQGGMGVAVSGWPLARAVALTGQLGVVSGTALEVVCARRLGDVVCQTRPREGWPLLRSDEAERAVAGHAAWQ